MTKLEETLAAAIEAIDDAIIEQADSLKPSEHGVRERRDKFFDDIAVKPDDFYISLVNDYGASRCMGMQGARLPEGARPDDARRNGALSRISEELQRVPRHRGSGEGCKAVC